MQYGESTVGTEATPDYSDETKALVLERDGHRCLVCRDDEDVTVLRRHAEWRDVPENLYSSCPQCAIMTGTGHAQASGWALTDHYGIGDKPFQTGLRDPATPKDDGWRWLTHGGKLVSKKPKVFSP